MRERSPLLAMGMNAAPFNFAKRQAVRSTMLQHDAVLAGRVVFRFIVGDLLVPTRPRRAATKSNQSEALWTLNRARLAAEMESQRDVLQLDAIDGPGVAMECPAAEKTIQWMRYALRTWPAAQFIGKTEDDTFVHLAALELELQRLSSLPNVLYGLMGICSMPDAARAERSTTGFKACFLGSLERVGWVTGAYRALALWRQGARGKKAKCAPGSAVPAPFPTGPLMVASASLAAAVFSS